MDQSFQQRRKPAGRQDHGAGTAAGRNTRRRYQLVRPAAFRRHLVNPLALPIQNFAVEFGVARARSKDLAGGTPDDNASIVREILLGKKGPKRDIVCLNAAPAFVATGKVKTLREGFQFACRIIDSGDAMEKLERLIRFSKRGLA